MGRQTLAVGLQSKGFHGEALPVLEGLVAEAPGNVPNMYNLSVAYAATDRTTESLAMTERVLAAQPGHANALALRRRLGVSDGGSTVSASP